MLGGSSVKEIVEFIGHPKVAGKNFDPATKQPKASSGQSLVGFVVRLSRSSKLTCPLKTNYYKIVWFNKNHCLCPSLLRLFT